MDLALGLDPFLIYKSNLIQNWKRKVVMLEC